VPSEPDRALCQAVVRTDLQPLTSVPLNAKPPGYGPWDIRSAYDLSGRHGKGKTVAIVVAWQNPDLESDLAVYRRQFHLPPCTTANGCLHVINQRGGTTLPPPTPSTEPGWALEPALDVDAVSAACPDCKILVVEGDDNFVGRSLLPANDQAVAQGAKFVSNSWVLSIGEAPDETTLDYHFRDRPGIAFTFAAGDSGYRPAWPATSPYVTAVGGTSLHRAYNRRGWTETVWPGTGSGCSLYEPKPSFQHDALCANRTINDVSADADPATGLAVYNTFGSFGGGWQVVGGTSLSTPLVAASYALAGDPAPNTYPNSYPYARPWAFNDIVTGTNDPCGGTYLCTAVKGYDGPTGIGTPHGVTGLRAWTR
jgi:subtilase family serine protease